VTADQILVLIGLVLALAACALTSVSFLKHDEDLIILRRRQITITALLFAAAAVEVPVVPYTATVWFIFGLVSLERIPTKKKAAKALAKKERRLAKQRAAELARQNAETDKLAEELGLGKMPRAPEQDR
jgi:hypothetical protein